ncbi:MAG TPA: tetratricopeptide repeat protein [Spirochaetota bacterium]|nr:tetratricopeptide repeat protein [Spirochaetota bacterium]HOR43629.1 tetratricopeptide repeat protein [Spirochaetota bacterium]HOU83506.1 tetratricopeptide repeat protein [Spirochaetota bacterium]HPK55062.1 tetratricopeptide repeat protein [Spirochaetota bacterium]
MKILIFILAVFIFSLTVSFSQNESSRVDDIMKKAREYYEQKKFSESLNEWLTALELDPGNEKIQQQIESLYEEKHKKDISLQRSKIFYWEARGVIERLKFGSSDFYDSEFKRSKLSLDALWNEIKQSGYYFGRIRFISSDRSIDRLNEIIRIPAFYDIWIKKNKPVENDEEVINLLRWTQYYRNKPYEELTEQELDNLKRLNRLLLEIAYPYTCPQSRTQKEEKRKDSLLAEADSNTKDALGNFVAAYRIDPNDPELVRLREQMKILEEDLRNELNKRRISEEKIRQYNEFITIARGFVEQEKYEESIPEWKKALGIMPQDIYAKEELRKAELAVSNRIKFEKIKSLLASGRVFFDAKKYPDSLAEYKQVISLDPKNRDALNYIARIEKLSYEIETSAKKRIQAEQFYQSGISNINSYDFDAALDDFNNTASLIPDYKDVQSRIKSIPQLKKNFADRLLRDKLVEIDKEFNNGLFYFSQANYKDALISFERTIKLDPNNETAIGFAKRVKEALKQQQEEVIDESSPYYDLVSSLIANGKILYEKGKYAESEENWRKILNLFPQNVIAAQYLARCQIKTDPRRFKEYTDKLAAEGRELLDKKDNARALKKFEILKSVNPEYPDIANLIALASRKPVRQQVNADLTATPQEIQDRYNEALAYYNRGGAANLRNARDNFRWVVDRDPENTKAIVALNRVEAELRASGSTIPVKKALTSEQEARVRELYFRGINYYSANRYQDAIAEWRKVLAIDPNHEKAKNNIRQTLILLKQ